MGRIAEEDKKIIAMMYRAGVLREVDGHRLPTPNGAILVFCGDGDQLLDLLPENIRKIFVAGDQVRPHALALNGGALLIPRESPLYQDDPSGGERFLRDIRGARRLKGIDTVALYAHAPCGMAAEFGINFEEVVRLLKLAKMRVTEEIRGMIVACFIHVDGGNGNGKKTFFVDGKAWRDEWDKLSHEERERRYGVAATVGAETF